MEEPRNPIKGRECRHATYSVAMDNRSDALVVKEYIHYPDGTRKPNLLIVENYKREFYVTKDGLQTHKDKLEWEKRNNVNVFKCTQLELPSAVARALRMRGTSNQGLRYLARSPFIYGIDIGTPSLIRQDYVGRWKDCVGSKATVAALDIETDVWGTDEIIMVGLTFGSRCIVTVTEWFFKGAVRDGKRFQEITDPIAEIHAKFDDLLGKYKKDRNITLEVVISKTPAEACKLIMDRAHEWQPDFVSIWNVNFDLPYITRTLEAGGYDLATVMSDPRVPAKYRHYRYKEGASQKITQSGKITPIHPADRWHTASHPASFYFIDSMCTYKKLRIAAGNEPSYSLDAILKSKLNLGKLKFTETDHLQGLAWHQRMQRLHKVEYVIYNIFDCIALELLDEKTGDISSAFPVQCGVSEYRCFSQNPRRIADDLHYYCLDNNLVMGSTSDEMVTELDKMVISMDGWIVTLPAFLATGEGLSVIRELPSTRSMIFAHNSDLDIAGTYPEEEYLLNISKETTAMEMARIRDVPEWMQREFGINLNGGVANAVELCTTMFKVPSPDQMLEAFRRDMCV